MFLAPPGPDLVAADERNNEACSRIQEIADANGINVSVLDYCG